MTKIQPHKFNKKMDTERQEEGKNPQTTNNPISKIFINWVRHYVVVAKTKIWEQKMHFPLLKQDLVPAVKPSFHESFKQTKRLWRTTWSVHKCELIEIFIALQVSIILTFTTAFFLSSIVRQVEQSPELDDTAINSIVLNFLGILLVNLLSPIIDKYYRFRVYHLSYKIKSATLSILTEKILKFSVANSEEYSEGNIINLIQVDIMRLEFLLDQLKAILTVFLSMIYGFIVIYIMVGNALFGVLFVTVVMNLIYTIIYKLRAGFQLKLLVYKDQRISFLKSVLKNVEYIKLNSLENFYCFKVYQKRLLEVTKIRQIAYLASCGFFVEWMTPGLTQVSIFWYFMYIDPDSFDFARFSGFMQVYEVLKAATIQFNIFMNRMVEMVISLRRLDAFLNAEEIDLTEFTISDKKDSEDGVAISMINGNFCWGSGKRMNSRSNKASLDRQTNPMVTAGGKRSKMAGEPGLKEEDDMIESHLKSSEEVEGFTLRDINLQVSHGEKVFVFGGSSSGKSSVLYSILGEMTCISKEETKVERNGSIVFLGQDQWTIGESVRANILLGTKEDEERLNRAIEMAQMKTDLKAMSQGLETILGDTGHTVSGGQRARLAIARCFYQK